LRKLPDGVMRNMQNNNMDKTVFTMPTHIIAAGGVLRPSDENRDSAFFSKEKVMDLITAPAVMERFKAYLEYNGRPLYLEYVTKPDFKLKLKRSI